jgi:hypothetical protein
MVANNYLLRERNGVIENVKEWYNPDTHTIMIEDNNGLSESIQLSPEESPKQYINTVKFQSTWCDYDRK